MPLFYYLDQQQRINVMSGYIDQHQNMNRIRGAISVKDEYRGLIGQEYRKQQHLRGKWLTGVSHIRRADIKAAETMYAYGYSRKAVINTIMKNSPLTKDMTAMQRLAYRERLGRAMKNVEPLRQQIQAHKLKHGITTNRVKDIRDFAKCQKLERQAQAQGLKVKPLTYEQFANKRDYRFHIKYQQTLRQKQQIKQVKQQQAQIQKQQQTRTRTRSI